VYCCDLWWQRWRRCDHGVMAAVVTFWWHVRLEGDF
jgi:hypothetical protein